MLSPLMTYSMDPQGVATITLNRPDKLNAFNSEMISLWGDLLDQAASDPAVKVIVVTGAGRAFCAGGDLEDLLSYRNRSALEFKDYLYRQVHRIALTMDRLEKPVIAALNGTARGAGLDMALMCDLRIAAASAVFAESYINIGMIAGDGGTYYLPRLIGTARALELFWTGRAVHAEEAERMGFVNRVVPDEDLMRVVTELAHNIAAQPQEAVRCFKRSVYTGMTMSLPAHLDMVSSHMAALKDTPDHQSRLEGFAIRSKTERA